MDAQLGAINLGAEAGSEPPSPGPHAKAAGCECPTCFEPLFEAMVAPCGHALCPPCVAKLCGAAKATTPEQYQLRGPPGPPPVPRCPECRTAVHRTQYNRCYALEKAAQALYPDQWEAYETSAEERRASGGADQEVDELDDLRAWKAARDEQAVAKVVQLVWKAIQGTMENSTALLINGQPLPRPSGAHIDCTVVHPYSPHVRIRPRVHVSESGEVDISEFIQEDATAELESVLAALWSYTDEIARRLEEKGLKMITFRYTGVDYALVTWPALPSPFGGRPAAAVVNHRGNRPGDRPSG